MYEVIKYEDKYEQDWDRFINEESINGTFLQSRNFLNYHPKDRFHDSSKILMKKNRIAAVLPGCIVHNEDKTVFSSHAGSTFGGFVIHKKDYKATNILEMVDTIDNYLREKEVNKAVFKITSDIFCSESSELLQYVLFNKGYDFYNEISTYIDLASYDKDIRRNFTSGQKENLKNSMKNNLFFKQLNTNDEISEFYNVLCDNLLKYNAAPVHSLSEIIEFHHYRLKDIVLSYGVYFNNEMIAGSILFKFNKVIHTQYLAAKQDFLNYRPMTFLYYNLIKQARDMNFEKLSWGISTEDHGKVLNTNLISFKESFGSKYSLNRVFYKEL